MVMGGVAIVGGLVIAAIAIAVSVPWATKEKIAKQEAATKERLALIEKGYDPEQVLKYKKTTGSDPLLWGCLLAGIGLGVLIGYLLSVARSWDVKILTNSLGLLLGGVGLIVYYIFRRKSND